MKSNCSCSDDTANLQPLFRFRNRIGQRVWRKLHYASFAAFLLALTMLEKEGMPRVWIGYLFMFATIGLYAVIGILLALHERAASGRGQFVDAALFGAGDARITSTPLGLSSSAEPSGVTSRTPPSCLRPRTTCGPRGCRHPEKTGVDGSVGGGVYCSQCSNIRSNIAVGASRVPSYGRTPARWCADLDPRRGTGRDPPVRRGVGKRLTGPVAPTARRRLPPAPADSASLSRTSEEDMR